MFFGFAKEDMGRQFSICTRVPHLNLSTPCRFKIWIKIIYFIDYHTWGKMPLCEKGLQTLPRDFVNKGASIKTCTSSCCETNPFGPGDKSIQMSFGLLSKHHRQLPGASYVILLQSFEFLENVRKQKEKAIF